jgi:hypothetical protein
MNLAEIEFSVQFWSWWSNPLIGMHDDHRYRLAWPIVNPRDLSYLSLLEVRRILELDDTPDELLGYHPEMRALAHLSDEEFKTRFQPFSYWLLDASVLNARPQDWEQVYGISSPDEIRDIISQRAALPDALLNWHGNVARTLNLNLKAPLFLTDRASVCLLIYLRSFYPRFYRRWKLTQSDAIVQASLLLDPIPQDMWDIFQAWAQPIFTGLEQITAEQAVMPEFNLDFQPDSDDFELDHLISETSGQEEADD